MKLARATAAMLAVLMLGAGTGMALDHAVWTLGWSYPGIDWLVLFYDADGEAAYDRATLSLVINSVIAWAVACFVLAWAIRRRRA